MGREVLPLDVFQKGLTSRFQSTYVHTINYSTRTSPHHSLVEVSKKNIQNQEKKSLYIFPIPVLDTVSCMEIPINGP